MFVYIVTNPQKTVLYTGVTNDLAQRLVEHYINRGGNKTFAGRYYCYNLLFFEEHARAKDAIFREKEIKNLSRLKKEKLISIVNQTWDILNSEIMEWPPRLDEMFTRGE